MKFQTVIIMLFVVLCLTEAGRVKRDRRRSQCVHLSREACEFREDAGCEWDGEACSSLLDGTQCFLLNREACTANRACEWFGGCQARF